MSKFAFKNEHKIFMRDAHVTMLGLIAGQGRLPFMVADGARAAGVAVHLGIHNDQDQRRGTKRRRTV